MARHIEGEGKKNERTKGRKEKKRGEGTRQGNAFNGELWSEIADVAYRKGTDNRCTYLVAARRQFRFSIFIYRGDVSMKLCQLTRSHR